MKKLTTVFLILMLMLGITACSNSQQNNNSISPSVSDTPAESVTETETETEEKAETEPTESMPEAGKTLVVYYSATGNTESAASYIAAAMNADILVLEPVEPYSDADLNYNNDESRVVYEHDNPEARNIELVSATVENWNEYDRVFIGYPIWWGIAAWPVDSFVKANDFTGKTVIPFATSVSSELGESGELLAELAGTGDWLEGKRFSSNVTEDDVHTWLDQEDFLKRE